MILTARRIMAMLDLSDYAAEKLELSDLPPVNPLKIKDTLQQLLDAVNSIPEVPAAYSERWENR